LTGRLATRSSFAALRKHGRRASNGLITVTFRDDADAAGPRVGLAVGKAVGNAVERNRIKRRLRTIARELDTAGTMVGGDYLLSVRPGADEIEYGKLKDMVHQAVTAVAQVRQ